MVPHCEVGYIVNSIVLWAQKRWLFIGAVVVTVAPFVGIKNNLAELVKGQMVEKRPMEKLKEETT